MAVQRQKPAVRNGNRFSEYLTNTRSPAIGLVVTLPLLLLYNIGHIVPTEALEINMMDFLTRVVFSFSGRDGLLLVNGLIVIANIVLVTFVVKSGRFKPVFWPFLLLEGLLYGLVIGVGFNWVALNWSHWNFTTLLGTFEPTKHSLMMTISLAAGAGYWEEFFFRLVAIGGVIQLVSLLTRQTGGNERTAKVFAGAFALVLSSLGFALMHHFGGKDFPESYLFWYRAVAGVVFGIVYLVRGFATVAWAHFIYDVVVMI